MSKQLHQYIPSIRYCQVWLSAINPLYHPFRVMIIIILPLKKPSLLTN